MPPPRQIEPLNTGRSVLTMTPQKAEQATTPNADDVSF